MYQLCTIGVLGVRWGHEKIVTCKILATCRNSQHVKLSTCMLDFQHAKRTSNMLMLIWHHVDKRFFVNMHGLRITCKKIACQHTALFSDEP